MTTWLLSVPGNGRKKEDEVNAAAEKKDLYLTNEWELKGTQAEAAATHHRLLTDVAFIANEVAFLLMEARNTCVSPSRAVVEALTQLGYAIHKA